MFVGASWPDDRMASPSEKFAMQIVDSRLGQPKITLAIDNYLIDAAIDGGKHLGNLFDFLGPTH